MLVRKILIFLVLSLAMMEGAVAAGIDELGVDAPDYLGSGSNFNVSIMASNADSIGSFQVDLLFDPAVLSANEVYQGDLVIGSFFTPNIDNSAGKVTMGIISATGFSGSGTIAKINFSVVGEGTSEFNLSVTDATDPSNEPATVSTITNTTFEVKDEPKITTIEVTPSTASLNETDTEQFTAIAYDQFGNEMSDVSFTWSSSNTTVGTVNQNGLFAALNSGVTMVNATNGSVTGSAAVTVNVLHEFTTIEVEPSSADLDVGETHQFTAIAYDQFGNEMSDVSFTWSSSNTTVGTVNQNGLFNASYPGNTTIEAVNGSVTGSADVTVGYNSSVTTIEVFPSNIPLTAGETQQLIATAYDQYNNEIPNVTFTWSSSNTTIGTVDENGLFTALNPGTTLVNATNGSVVGTAAVNVQRLNVTQFQCGGGSPGDEIQANVTLKNGGGPAWFVVKVTGVNNETGYPLAFGTGVVYLDQNDEVDIPLIVSLLPNLDEGTYELFVDVWEYGDHFNVSRIAFRLEEPVEVTISS